MIMLFSNKYAKLFRLNKKQKRFFVMRLKFRNFA